MNEWMSICELSWKKGCSSEFSTRHLILWQEERAPYVEMLKYETANCVRCLSRRVRVFERPPHHTVLTVQNWLHKCRESNQSAFWQCIICWCWCWCWYTYTRHTHTYSAQYVLSFGVDRIHSFAHFYTFIYHILTFDWTPSSSSSMSY